MPAIFVQNGYRVSFYSYDLAERMQAHVFKAGHECKVWLDDLTLAFNYGFRAGEIAEIRRMVTAPGYRARENFRCEPLPPPHIS